MVANQFNGQLFNLLTHARADQGVKLILKFIEGRMGVKLRITVRQSGEQPGNEGLIHASILEKSKDDASVADTELAEDGPGARRKRMMNQRVKSAIPPMARGEARVEPKGIEGEPEALNAEGRGIGHK